MGIRILGTGSYLPKNVVTNDDIAKTLDTNDEWIFSHTGIRSRHIASSEEPTSFMATEAAKNALTAAGVAPNEIGLIIVATSTADYNPFPSTACLVQGALDCEGAGAFDLQAACSGFVYALEMAKGYVLANPSKKAIVIGADSMTKVVDWTDRASCILFGDGAGAVVIGSDGTSGPLTSSVELGADGKNAKMIIKTGGTIEEQKNLNPKFVLAGHEVFAFAVRKLAQVTDNLCAGAGETAADLDMVFAHQANSRIIEATARRMKLPLSKFFLNVETTANTSAASIPIALDQAVRNGTLHDGMKITMIGFGAGLTYAGMRCVWPSL